MSFPSVTLEPMTELDPDYEYALQERERVVYEMRRVFKKCGSRYQFWHAAPPGTTGLVIRDPMDLRSLTDRLTEMKFEFPGKQLSCSRDFRSASGNSIRVHVRLANCDEDQHPTGTYPTNGPILLITTHTVL
jgi:hypothetical protein